MMKRYKACSFCGGNRHRDSKKEKKRINIKENLTGAEKLSLEDLLEEELENPMVQLRYTYALDEIRAKLRLIHADLTAQSRRPVIRNLSSRIKTAESIGRKLVKKQHEISFETAVATLNDIAGIRVVCYFCDDIYQVAAAIREQSDLRVIKEKDYVKRPKKSGYQSVHLIVGVPVTYRDRTQEIRVEVQIRSFAMDYWAEMDTQMCYKKNTAQILHVERETKNYSDLIAEVDNKMLELRRRIEGG